MSAAATDATGPAGSGQETWQTARPTWRVRLATAWLLFFFWLARNFPRMMSRLAGGFTLAIWLFTDGLKKRAVHQATMLLGSGASPARVRELACGIVRNFYLFVCDVARHRQATLEEMRRRIESVSGSEHYEQARALNRGLIVATAHLGSFEVGVAALRDREENIHIVFQSDRLSSFDTLRSELHRQLGVREARVDAGWETWIRLRDALGRNEVVLMQADRVMPGQQGVAVPFAGRRLWLPLGPIKLARLTGSPILPIYALRLPEGRIRIEIDPMVQVTEADAVAPGEVPPALGQLARSLEDRVMRYPEQWLVLQDVWAGPTDAVRQTA